MIGFEFHDIRQRRIRLASAARSGADGATAFGVCDFASEAERELTGLNFLCRDVGWTRQARRAIIEFGVGSLCIAL
jgi:hypothetical protein